MRSLIRSAVMSCLFAGLAACVPTTPNLDARFGESVEMLKAKQTANPDASRNADPVAGLDGRAARGAMENYRDSFRTPPVNTLSIGGSGGAP